MSSVCSLIKRTKISLYISHLENDLEQIHSGEM